jgi:hypothetical protein
VLVQWISLWLNCCRHIFFSSLLCPNWLLVLPDCYLIDSQAHYTRVRQQRVKLATNLHLVSKLKTCGPVTPTYRFMTLLIKHRAWFPCTLPSPIILINDFLIAMNFKSKVIWIVAWCLQLYAAGGGNS